MIPLSLTAGQQQAYHRALTATARRIRVRVEVLDMNERTLLSATPRVLSGQVNVDADAEVTRSGTMTLFDPTSSLEFDTSSPNDGALYLDRMLKVWYCVWVPSLAGWVDCPVLTGPVVKFDRDGYEVNIEAQGKEAIARAAVFRPMNLKAGLSRVEAIRRMLAEGSGESRFAFPDGGGGRLPDPVTLHRVQYPWIKSQVVAFAANRHLYYSGDGVCRLRHYPTRPCFEFKSHTDDASITSRVQVSTDLSEVKNAVLVKGSERGVEATAVAPRTHPLSPWRLGRDNEAGDRVPRYLLEEHEDDSLRSDAECQKVADRILADRLRAAVEVTYGALPIPHLDPLDVVQVTTPDAVFEHKLKKFSLPLTADSEMSIGYHKRVSVNRRAIRR